jgi:hypothetical protein
MQFFREHYSQFELSPDGRYVAAKLPGEEDGACIPPPPSDGRPDSGGGGGSASPSPWSSPKRRGDGSGGGGGGGGGGGTRSGRSEKPDGTHGHAIGRSASPGSEGSTGSSGSSIIGRSEKLCMYLARPGGCRAGDTCRFSHSATAPAAAAAVAAGASASVAVSAAGTTAGATAGAAVDDVIDWHFVPAINAPPAGAGKPPKSPVMSPAMKTAPSREEVFALEAVCAAPA